MTITISSLVPPSIQRGVPRTDTVTILQDRLIALGYLTGFSDGKFGPITASAVMAFQRSVGLVADGVVGPLTAAALDGVKPVVGGIIPVIADMNHANSLNLTQLKTSTVIGIIHKATQGIGFADDAYTRRRSSATEMGFLWGAYSFSTGDPVAVNVARFLSVAAPDAHTALCLDFEDNSASEMSGDQAYEFLDRLNQAVGHGNMIYGGNRIREHIDPQQAKWIDMAKVTRLWQSRYIGLQPADTPELFHSISPIPPWTSNFMIQYAADGFGPGPHQVSGLENGADLSAYNGTADELRAAWATPSINIGANRYDLRLQIGGRL